MLTNPQVRAKRAFSKISFEDRGYKNKCWIWTGGWTGAGYGQFTINKKKVTTHRWFYSQFIGEIPEGYQVDHLCRQIKCCNPWHLEAVTPKVNYLRGNGSPAVNARKTHCIYGHPLSGDNLVMDRTSRQCRICNNRRALEKYYRNKERG